MKNPRQFVIGLALVVALALVSAGAWWLTSRPDTDPDAEGPSGSPSESLSPIASEPAPTPTTPPEDWAPTVEPAWEGGDPNAVAEAVRQVLTDDSIDAGEAASKIEAASSPTLAWSIGTADLTVFHGAEVTGVTAAEVGSETVSVVFSGVSSTGEQGSLFTVTLAREQIPDDEGGSGVTDNYYATHVTLGDLLAEGAEEPLPLSLDSEAAALEAASTGVDFLVDPATHHLSDEQKQSTLEGYFLSPENAAKIGPVVNDEGREMTTEATASSAWITEPGASPQAFLSGAWVDPLDSAYVGGWNYGVTFDRNEEGDIVPVDVLDPSQMEGNGQDE